MYPLLPSQRPDANAPSLPDAGRSLPTSQVEAFGVKKEVEDEHKDEQDILTEAMDRFRTCSEYDQTWRRNASEEMDFVSTGCQHWSPEMIADRQGQPALSFNKIQPSLDQVVNDARQNPPEPKVSAVGAGADKDLAELLQGLLRNIDNDSSADIAYMTGYDHAVKIGRGWWRVNFEFETDEGEGAALFQQKLVIKRIPNPFSVYPDPAAEEFDYSDMRYCFVTEDLDLPVFEELYPDAYTGTADYQGLSDKQRDDWFPKGAVRVAEYWRVKIQRTRVALLPNGQSVKLADIPEGMNAVSTRWKEKRTVECHKITGAQVLESTAWPGKWIPLVPCLGQESIKEGKRVLGGMIRPAMSANLSYDYLRSRQVQMIGLASLAPYLVAAGQLEGFEDIWNSANRKPHAFLPYHTMDSKGNQVGPPQRNFAQEAAIMAITQAVQFADNDIKAMLSTYDASLGKEGPESSGKAILARQKEGDNAHFHYHDNLARSIRHTARIELNLIPHIYSEERTIALFDPDGSIKQAAINQPTQDKHGQPKHYKMADATRCDVVAGSGPSYATRRLQGAAALTELVRNIPQQMTRALDLVVLALDIPDGDKIADRLRPPDVQQEQDGQDVDPQQALQKLQAQLQQQVQMGQLLTQHVNELSEIIKSKRVETESAERQTTQTNMTGILKAEISSKGSEAQAMAKLDHDGVKHELEARAKLLHNDLDTEQDAAQHERERQTLAEQRAHEQELQKQAQAHQGEMQQRDQSHAAELQGLKQQHEAALAAQRPQETPPAAPAA
jgi:hypothetical protein